MVLPVDQSLLDVAISTRKTWSNVGAYESLSKTQAANGNSLADQFAPGPKATPVSFVLFLCGIGLKQRKGCKP